jgi:hypothetical protein
MTDREAIRRLIVNSGDCLAVSWLQFNHHAAIRAIVTRLFGHGPSAEKAEYDLMQRIAARARSFDGHENSEKWLLKCAASECEILHKESNPGPAKRH